MAPVAAPEQEFSTTRRGIGRAWRSRSTSRCAATRSARPSSRTRASTPSSWPGSKSPCPMKCSTCHSLSSSRSCRSAQVAAGAQCSSARPWSAGRASARASWSCSLSTSRAGSPRGEETTPRIRSGGLTRSGASTEATGTCRTSWSCRHTYAPVGLVVHRLPRQPGQRRGIDAQHHPQPLPALDGHRRGGPVPPGHLACSEQPGEQHLASLPDRLLGLRQHPAARHRRGQHRLLQQPAPRQQRIGIQLRLSPTPPPRGTPRPPP